MHQTFIKKKKICFSNEGPSISGNKKVNYHNICISSQTNYWFKTKDNVLYPSNIVWIHGHQS